jgi:hypothetical protein
MAIKVKQSTIDSIKKMGMTKALAAAKSSRNSEYQEAVKRMYGAKRVAKAIAGSKTTRSSIPVGGVMGTKRAQVMAGPVKSTLKKKTTPKYSSNAVQEALTPKRKVAQRRMTNGSSVKSTPKKKALGYDPKQFNTNTTRKY